MTLPCVNWNYPTAIKAGPGRIRELPELCRGLGMTRPLLVTDPGLAALPMVADVLRACGDAGLECGLFHEIKGNPTGRNVDDGVRAYKQGSHDGVIAFGGGSALDAAKAIALMAGQTRPLWDFEDIGDNYLRVDVAGMAPVVAVPTTAGTGSEVGRASVITDEAAEVKRIIFHARMLPSVVILDPELTVGLPPKITAATGMDALSHNLEAYCSPFFHPMAAGIAIEGMRLVKEYLPQAVADGGDLQARLQMLVASSMGATAFQRGLGAMHALAHPLGALYDAHHGTLNAILMPYVLKANQHAVAPRLEALARYLGLPDPGPGAVLDWVLSLRETLGIPHTLAEIGIDDAQAERVGRMAAEDPSAGGNPVNYTPEQYSDLFRAAIRGNL
ncbi:iron-containing alcohol dehydrogenase family protein 3 [Achromobacter xylosoxidans A8]|uniref:Iron-containing alcohol dehydrogenase family protein 3 n=1 Tax=Achromobacter xylosoxidans (strain A8) TaxID=762376 RepID=E3HT27_ACHXA|nr:iron-containing alcohol dehydrogenase [Achromobacter xylosoxidans]ADP19771.1 iron-containing alcohol dehydrogenase family protein 3 [Achromobacter xylosoxidans A8]